MSVFRVVIAAALAALFLLPIRADVLPPVQDTSSLRGKVSLATGRATTLPVSALRKAFVLFNINSIPIDVTANDIANARLRVYFPTAAHPGDIHIYTVAATGALWGENSAANEPTVSAEIAYFPASTVVAKKFVEVDVTSTVRAWRTTPTANYGFAFAASGVTNVTLGAKEGAGSGYPCELEVEIDRGGGGGGFDGSQLTAGSITSTQLASDLTLGGVTTLSGGLSLPATSSSNVGVIALGGVPVLSASGSQNIFLGAGAGNFTIAGDYNVAVGASALSTNTTGAFNTAAGFEAMLANSTGHHNTAIGQNALSGNTTGNRNLAIGDGAGQQLTTGSDNIAIGHGGIAGDTNVIRIGSGQTDTYLAGVIHGNGSAITGVPLSTGVTGTLGVTNGGTGITSYNAGDLLCASGPGTLAKVSTTNFGRTLLTAPDNAALATALGGDAQMWVWPHFESYNTSGGGDERLYISVSLDGNNWLKLNNGAPVYTAPGWGGLGSATGVVRDPCITDHSDGYFYVCHTSGNYGFDRRFAIIRSRDLVNWTFVTYVDTSAKCAPGHATWSPSWAVDENGVKGIVVAVDGGSGIKLTWYRPNTAGNFSGSWDSGTYLNLPGSLFGYNDAYVWTSPVDGRLRMTAIDPNSDFNSCYCIFHSSSMTGLWTRDFEIYEAQTEGGWPLVRSGTDDFDWMVEKQGAAGLPYSIRPITANYKDPGLGSYNNIVDSPVSVTRTDGKPNNGYNGKGKLIRSPILTAYAATTYRMGRMAQQDSAAVSITGGTISGVTSIVSYGITTKDIYGNVGVTLGVSGGVGDRIDSGTGVVAIGFGTATDLWFGCGDGTGDMIIGGAGAPTDSGERLQVNGTARISGALGAAAINSSGQITSSMLQVNGAATIGGTSTTAGITNTGAMTNTGTFTNTGNATVTGNLGATGTTTLGSVKVGGASASSIAGIYTGIGSLDYPPMGSGNEQILTISVPGATTANTPSVTLGWSTQLEPGITVTQAWVSNADTVSVRVRNEAPGPIDPAAITCRATVTQF